MELLTPASGTLFWTAITFLLLLYILKKMAWKPILQALDEREKRIKESLEKADLVQKESEETLARQKEIVEAARKEAQELLNKSRKTADATKEEIIQRANTEAENMLKRAKKEIELEREKAVEELKAHTAELSIQIASKIIRKTLSEKDHKDVIEESLQKIVEAN